MSIDPVSRDKSHVPHVNVGQDKPDVVPSVLNLGDFESEPAFRAAFNLLPHKSHGAVQLQLKHLLGSIYDEDYEEARGIIPMLGQISVPLQTAVVEVLRAQLPAEIFTQIVPPPPPPPPPPTPTPGG